MDVNSSGELVASIGRSIDILGAKVFEVFELKNIVLLTIFLRALF